MRTPLLYMALIVSSAAALADGAPKTKPKDDVQMSGMSVLGNDEAPKSLVIVPWKSSKTCPQLLHL